jgi:hypothetical protein
VIKGRKGLCLNIVAVPLYVPSAVWNLAARCTERVKLARKQPGV